MTEQHSPHIFQASPTDRYKLSSNKKAASQDTSLKILALQTQRLKAQKKDR